MCVCCAANESISESATHSATPFLPSSRRLYVVVKASLRECVVVVFPPFQDSLLFFFFPSSLGVIDPPEADVPSLRCSPNFLSLFFLLLFFIPVYILPYINVYSQIQSYYYDQFNLLNYSPSGCRLDSVAGIAQYIQRDDTCKCGLPCPLRLQTVFNFDPTVSSSTSK